MANNRYFRKLKLWVCSIPHRGREPYLSYYKITGFYPHSLGLYEEAMRHRSSSKRDGNHLVNNERLEFLGDAILDAIVADILFKKFRHKQEGFLTNMRSRIVKRETLNRLSQDLGIDKLIISNTSITTHNSSIYGDALEALIGALYLDQGYRAAKKFVYERLIKKHITISDILQQEVDFKSRLIELGQKNKVEVRFEVKDSFYDSDNNPLFRSEVYVGDVPIAEGIGYSKKESHQKAAQKALAKIQDAPLFFSKTN